MDVRNKRVLVVGMARSGIAAAKLLAQKGAAVTINDMKPEEAFGGQLDELRALGNELKMTDYGQYLLTIAKED